MKKFFNSYRIIGLLSILFWITNGILYDTKILTNKEYFVILGAIFFLTIISYLINYIVDISKSINLLKEHNKILNNAIIDSILINNFLTNMCLIG